MKINNQEVNIDDLVSSKYMHKEINKGIFLSEYQIEVLSRYGIIAEEYPSINSLMYAIDEALFECDEEELDNIYKEIAEFNYYSNVNK
jgi:hypothetical protein